MPTSKPGESTKQVVIPRGWRRLRNGEIIKRGDRLYLERDEWDTPLYLTGTPVVYSKMLPTIRRVTGNQRDPIPVTFRSRATKRKKNAMSRKCRSNAGALAF